MTRAAYPDTLRAMMEKRAPEQPVVFVVASDGASYASLVDAIDAAKSAGASTVGLAAEAVQ